jgi:hypothetical protein
VAGSSEHCNELRGSREDVILLDYLSEYQLPKKLTASMFLIKINDYNLGSAT